MIFDAMIPQTNRVGALEVAICTAVRQVEREITFGESLLVRSIR